MVVRLRLRAVVVLERERTRRVLERSVGEFVSETDHWIW